MDTLRSFINSCYQGGLIFQVILYDEVPTGTMTKCVDYAGVLIIKCPG